MSDTDQQDKSLSNRFNTIAGSDVPAPQTSSLGLTADQDKLINAASGDKSHFGNAGHFGFAEVKQKEIRERKKEHQKDRDFIHIMASIRVLEKSIEQGFDDINANIAWFYGFSGDMLDDAEKYRQEKREALSFKNDLAEALDKKDFIKNEDGTFKNAAMQKLREREKNKTGKDVSDINGMIVLIGETIKHYEGTYIPTMDKAITDSENLSQTAETQAEKDKRDVKEIKADHKKAQHMEDSEEKETALFGVEQQQKTKMIEQEKAQNECEQERVQIKQDVLDASYNTTEDSTELKTKATADIFSDDPGTGIGETDPLPPSSTSTPSGF